jgi:hypothetical protein
MRERDIVGVRRRSLLLGTLSGAGALLVGTEAHAANIVETLLGAYRHADPEKERRDVAAAIEEVVNQMSSLVRSTAREKLKAANPIPASLVIAADKQSFMLAYDGELFAAPLDGKPVKVKSKAGEEMALQLTVAKSAVEQRFWSEDKSRRNGFAFSDWKLVIAVTVEATLLPKPLQYRLTYSRT